MTSQEPDKKPELDAMMKRLGLLGIENREPGPGGQGAEKKKGKAAEPQSSPPLSPGRAQADELKDFLKHLETLEKDGVKQVEGLGPESDSVMAKLEKLDLASLETEARAPAPAQPSPRAGPEPAQARPQAPRKDDDFVALIRGIEEVKRDLTSEGGGKQAVRREIKAEKVDTTVEKRRAPPEAEPQAKDADYASILDRLDKLDLANVGGETKTDIGEITAWKKDIRREPKGSAPAPEEAVSPQPPQAVQGGDTEAILKRLEGLSPAEPKAPAARPAPAQKEAAPRVTVKAAHSGQEIDPEVILKKLEGLTPEEARAVAQKVALAAREAAPPRATKPVQPAQGVDAESILRRLGEVPSQGRAPPRKEETAEPAPRATAAPAERRAAGRSKWEAVAPPAEEQKAKAAQAPDQGTGKDGSAKDVTSVIDNIFKVHKGAPVGAPSASEDVDASLKQIIEGEGTPADEGAGEKEEVHAKKTRWSEGEMEEGQEAVVSVDEIKDISNLILPKGATFAIDEVKLHEHTAVFNAKGSVIPSELAENWQSQLPSGVIKDIVIGKTEEAKPKGLFGKLNIMKVIRKEVEEYNPRIHGPLVDLDFRPAPNIEEVEVYPVNEPYAFIRVLHDNASHEYTYTVLEPVLNQAEKDLVVELKQRLFETLEVNTKDLTKEAAHKAIRGAVDIVLSDYGISLTPVAREKILYNIEKEFLGDGLVDPVMHDKYIEDISCDGMNVPIFVYHTSYENTKTNLIYKEAEDLDSFVTKMAQRAGKHISIAEPILDATMPDGSRIQMTLGSEVTAHGSTFTIRKFREEPITPT
ncbi:MAG: type II/IV secretion system ATPase subunit, partial [Methanomicrobiales archaeon]